MADKEKKIIKLYRFEKNQKERCDTILNKQLWISAPSEFNDLDDCRMPGMFRVPLTTKEHDKISKGIELFYPDEAKLENEVLSREILQQIKHFIAPYANDGTTLEKIFFSAASISEIRRQIQTTTGVHCFFGDSPDNALMWAHYADNHKGFCIEYEVAIETPGLLEVNYSSKLPAPSVTELLFSPEETLRRILTTKKMEWNYEKEWRLVYLRALNPGEKGMNIERPDTIKPVRIITGEKYNLGQKANEDFAIDMAKGMGLERLSYRKYKAQLENA